MNACRFRMASFFLTLIILSVIAISTVFSQPKRGMYCLTTTISKGFLPSEHISSNNDGLNIGMAYMLSDQVSPHFSCFGHIGLVYASYTIAIKPASDIFTSATTGLTWYF